MNIPQKDFAVIVSNAIDENGEMTWKDIQFLAAKFCDFNPDNHANGWMPIRDALQIAINAGLIRRTKDVHKEVYEAAS